MQAWCIIVREMKCVCSESKLLAGCWWCRVIEMLTGRENSLDFMYTRGVFLCHGLSLLEPSSIFQMSQVLPFHVGDHVWCDASWNIWDTGVLVCRWGRVIWSSVLDTWFQSLWNYYCMGMLFPMIKRQFPFSPIHRVFWEKKENDEP